jgi:uncharacterized low-complexity protein
VPGDISGSLTDRNLSAYVWYWEGDCGTKKSATPRTVNTAYVWYWEGNCGTKKSAVPRTVPGDISGSLADRNLSAYVWYWEGDCGTKNRRNQTWYKNFVLEHPSKPKPQWQNFQPSK